MRTRNLGEKVVLGAPLGRMAVLSRYCTSEPETKRNGPTRHRNWLLEHVQGQEKTQAIYPLGLPG
jgi:hypothetical protein